MKLFKICFVLACISIASVSRAQTINMELPILKGEWKLDSIIQIQGENKLTALSPKDIVPDTIYYACPVKIIFKEQAGNCQFFYENEETKNIYFYVIEYPDSIRQFHVSYTNQTAIPEWMFEYILLIETQTSLILKLEHSTKPSDTKIVYEYFYSKNK